MKNINYVINGVLAVAVIILFVMQFSSKKESTVAPAFTTEGDSTNLLPVAYVNVDSLLSNYNYSKDLNERILKMQEDYRLDMTQRSNALRTELNDFQRKYEANAFLTTERAQQEGNRLQKKQEELQNYAAKKEQELAAKQMELNGQLRDTIVAQLTTFNQTKGYQIIFSNTMGDNILLSNTHFYCGNLGALALCKELGVSAHGGFSLFPLSRTGQPFLIVALRIPWEDNAMH